MDPHSILLQALKTSLKEALRALGYSRVLVKLLLRKGLSFVRSVVLRISKELCRILEQSFLLFNRLPALISRLSQAVGAQWFALWFLCFNSRVLRMWKWTLRQLLNVEFSTSDYIESIHQGEPKRIRGFWSPMTMALSVLGGLIR